MRRIGRYEVLRTLSERIVSEVLLVRHPGVPRPLALKRLQPRIRADWAAVSRFRDGAAAATTLQHTNIVAAHCVGGGADEVFVVTDFVPGLSLEDLVACTGAVPPRVAVSIAFGAICGLRYAHAGVAARPMAHESVSPRSIRITPEGLVTLVDFGTSTVSLRMADDPELTPCGDRDFGSAWQYTDGYRVGDRAQPRFEGDLFSLGAVLYELVTGAGPFEAETYLGVCQKTLLDPIVAPSELEPDVPDALERIILKSLSRDRSQRYASADAMWRDLEALAANPEMAPSRAAVARCVAPYA